MKTSPKIYDTVCMNGNPDAAVFRVVEVDGLYVGLVDACIDRKQAIQWTPRSLCQPATRQQLKNAGLI